MFKKLKIFNITYFYIVVSIFFIIPIIKFFYFEINNITPKPFAFYIDKSINIFLPVLFIFVVLKFFIYKEYSSKNDFILDLFCLLISWSASLSWGYNTILLSLPFLLIIFRNQSFITYQPIHYLFVFICLSLRIVAPYVEQSILKTSYKKIENIPLYSGIFTEEKNIVFLNEATELHNKYKNTLFLPAFPAAVAMYNEPSSIAPWEMDIEYANHKNIQKDWKKLSNQNIFYIIEKQETIPVKSTLTELVKRHKIKIDSTSLFYIYH